MTHAGTLLRKSMNKGLLLLGKFLLQLAGFILGGLAGWFLVVLVLWLAFGAPQGERSAVIFGPMLFVGPVGAIIGGFVGMRLAGRVVKASSYHDAEGGDRDAHK